MAAIQSHRARTYVYFNFCNASSHKTSRHKCPSNKPHHVASQGASPARPSGGLRSRVRPGGTHTHATFEGENQQCPTLRRRDIAGQRRANPTAVRPRLGRADLRRRAKHAAEAAARLRTAAAPTAMKFCQERSSTRSTETALLHGAEAQPPRVWLLKAAAQHQLQWLVMRARR